MEPPYDNENGENYVSVLFVFFVFRSSYKLKRFTLKLLHSPQIFYSCAKILKYSFLSHFLSTVLCSLAKCLCSSEKLLFAYSSKLSHCPEIFYIHSQKLWNWSNFSSNPLLLLYKTFAFSHKMIAFPRVVLFTHKNITI